MAEQDREFALLCPRCGEENPPGFPVCWSCHGDLPEVPPGEERIEEPRQDPEPVDLAARAARRTRLALEVAVVLIVVWSPWLFGGIWNAVDPYYPPETVALVLRDLLHGSGIVALLFYFAWLDGDWRRRLGLERPHIGKEILCGLGVWVVFVLSDVLVFALTNILGLGAPTARTREFEPAALWIAPLLFLLYAFVEEAFYRAYLWGRLMELSRRPALSITISAGLFSFAHFYPFPASLVIFLDGLFLGWLFRERRSLWGLALGHCLYNLWLEYG